MDGRSLPTIRLIIAAIAAGALACAKHFPGHGRTRTDSHMQLPVVSAEFRAASGSTGLLLDRVIPDTGADTTTLPWSDCQKLHLNPALGVPGVISGVAGGMAVTIGFLIWVWLDGQEYPCQLQADFAGQKRILGRDVLNRLDVLFRGPSGEVIVNP